MAKKHKHRLPNLTHKLAQAKKQGDAKSLMAEAAQLLKTSNYSLAIEIAKEAHQRTGSTEQEPARQLLIEAYIRTVTTINETQRREPWAQLIEFAPEEPRVRYLQALELLRAGEFAEALKELNAITSKQAEMPILPMLGYFTQLARLANGKSLEITNLSAEEANTLQIVAALLKVADLPTDLLDQPLLKHSKGIWQSLSLMQKDPLAAPIKELQESLAKINLRPINGVLEYYQGVGAMRKANPEAARAVWIKARSSGNKTRRLAENLARLQHKELLELVNQQQWQKALNLIDRNAKATQDEMMLEIASHAHYHLGYQAATANNWPLAVKHWRPASKYAPSCRLAQNLAIAEESAENFEEAAESWREMLRRRSRKAGNPNYLDRNQVVAIWRRAAEDYRKIDNMDEAITCLKTALKYAEDNIELRLIVVDAFVENGQLVAAINELKRIRTKDPKNVTVLSRLANLFFQDRKLDEAIEAVEQALAIDATNAEAQAAATEIYLLKARWYPREREAIAFLTEVMKKLPDQSRLLIALAKQYRGVKKEAEELDCLTRAHRAEPQNFNITNTVLHESLHLKKGVEFAEQLIAELRQESNLSNVFWIEQGKQAIGCDFDIKWIKRFFDEALEASERIKVKEQSKAVTLLRIAMELTFLKNPTKAVSELTDQFGKRILNEVAETGVVEYLAGFQAYQRQNIKEARKQLKEAERKAKKCGETEVLATIEEAAQSVSEQPIRGLRGKGVSMEMLMRLMERFPNRPPTAKELNKLPAEELEALASIFGDLINEIDPDDFLKNLDPYRVLGLERTADAAQIKRAYFQLVREYSPESAPEKFQEIRAAYEQLRSPERRAQADLLMLQSPPPMPEWSSANQDLNVNRDDIIALALELALAQISLRTLFQEPKLP